jgi:hypothetical protein
MLSLRIQSRMVRAGMPYLCADLLMDWPPMMSFKACAKDVRTYIYKLNLKRQGGDASAKPFLSVQPYYNSAKLA